MKFSSFSTRFLATTATLVLLAGCTTNSQGQPTMMNMGSKETIGTIAGAAGGAALGSRFGGGSGKVAMTAVGTLLGAYLGNEIGASLDRADQAAMGNAFNQAYAAPVGQSVRWNNPNSGNSGTITTTRDGYSQAGYYCREFQQTVTIQGRQQQAYGTACQSPDGTWQIVQ